LCSNFTFVASVNPILYVGAKPVLIDAESETWNMSPYLLEKAIKDRLNNGIKPKAILLVYLYGMPAKWDEISAIAQKYDIPIIEDAAEAMGSLYKGKPLGSLGEIGIYSFNGNKIITTSGGGALLSHSRELVEKADFLAQQAKDIAPHYQHSELGYNYKMSNILAGIGCAQMDVLEQRLAKRRANFQTYFENLKNLEVEFLHEPEGFFSNRWLTTVVFRDFKTREKVKNLLLKYGIESRPLWKPMHLQPMYQNEMVFTNGLSEDLFQRGLCLPSGSQLTEEELDEIIGLIKKSIS
jgi:dTDP-4-amino-4,6-dideoxygalactose transaminase